MPDTSQYPDSIGKINQGKNVNSRRGLTPGQRSLLNFIEAYSANRSIMPSFEEMKDAMGLNSKSGIHRMVVALERRGHLVRGRGAREMAVVGRGIISTQEAIGIVLERCRMTPDTVKELRFLVENERAMSGGAA